MEDKFRDFTLKIPLFEQVEVLVKKGHPVKEGQVVAKISRSEEIQVDLAKALKVKPAKVAAFLEVGPGREIKKGQVLAQKKKLFKKKKVLSPAAGEVKGLIKDEGILKIQKGKQVVEVRSPVEAKIVDQEDNFLVLCFPALVFSASQTFGKSGWGKLKDFSSTGILDLKKAKGKIALVKNLTLAVFNKLEALEAAGIVCFKMNKEVEKQADEIGILLLAKKDFEKACEHEGRRAKVDVGDKRLIVAK